MAYTAQINANQEKIQALRLAISKLQTQTSNLYTLGWEIIEFTASHGWKGSKKNTFQQQISGLDGIKTSANTAIGTAISDYNAKINELDAQINTWQNLDLQERIRAMQNG